MSRLAIITGAASGIGLEIAKFLETKGYRSVAFDIKEPPKEADIPHFYCDVSSEESVAKAYAQAKKEFGPCALLVNNSGLQHMAPVEEFPLDKWNLLIGVMLTGTFLCSRIVVPDMKQQNFGRIINISSIHGKVASPFKSAYVSAKHGVLGLTKVMAKELADFGITVNAVCPGFVDTPLMRQQVKSQMELNNMTEDDVLSKVFLNQQEIKKLTSPHQVAELVGFLASENASTITGEALNISGGWGMGH